MKVIIIGNGIAGLTVAQELRKDYPDNEKIEIKLFSKEKFPHYNKPKLPRFIGNADMKIDEVIGPFDRTWYEKRFLDLHLDEEVISVNQEKKKIITSNKTYRYDKLVFATGSQCRIPNIEGRRLKGFFNLRTLKDANAIKKKIEKSQNAVIMGGGILGIEIAHNINKRGIKVTVIETNRYLLHKQLDEEGSRILQKILEKEGIEFILNTYVKKVEGNKEEVQNVVLENGVNISTDMIITCVGIESNTKLAKEASLDVNRGIIVNSFLETIKNKDIYAAGDCAEHNYKRYGLWFTAIEQAKVVAHNIIEPRSTTYEGSKISTSLKVADIIVSSIRYTGKEKELGYETKKYINLEKEEYLKLFIAEDTIMGALIIGIRKAISFIKGLVIEEELFSENREEILNYVPNMEN